MVDKDKFDRFMVGVMAPLVSAFVTYASADYLLTTRLDIVGGTEIALFLAFVTIYKAWDLTEV